MENIAGMKEADVIDGVKFGGAISALFADDTVTLSY
jgi:hypothetical protein